MNNPVGIFLIIFGVLFVSLVNLITNSIYNTNITKIITNTLIILGLVAGYCISFGMIIIGVSKFLF